MPDNTDPIAKQLREAKMAEERRKIGFDQKPIEESAVVAIVLLQMLPVDRLDALRQKCATSPRLRDRLRARELTYLLFAKQEIDKVHDELTMSERVALIREHLESDVASTL